ncbi:hypothetical protein HAZT_HAZT009316 [Hyalella azteca]|nr:hypothetical protein HAZT_HAZT009316 [Hyalella azteca]
MVTSGTCTSKRLRTSDEDGNEVISAELSPAAENEDNIQTPTKQVNVEASEWQQRKRHKPDFVASDVVTPETSKSDPMPTCTTRGSARKKLVMEETKEASIKENGPATGNNLHLSKCKKLSELRAQLLKVRQCERQLEQFRSGVIEPAQLEAQQAAALIAKQKGLPSSPSKTGSPLKMASPRKLFSPHKELALPYKAAPSPRRRPVNPLLEHFSSALEVEVPLSPVKTPCKSPGKELGAVPAYERFHHLVQSPAAAPTATTSPSSELGLPYHYRLLREMFRAVDTVVSLMHNRHEVITFSKLKPAVQQMIRRTFQERNLGQVSRVFPLAYIFRQDKVRPGPSITQENNSGYQLTITANLDYKNQHNSNSAVTSQNQDPPVARMNLMTKFDSPASSSSRSLFKEEPLSNSGTNGKDPTFRKMDSLVLVERRAFFHEALIKIVHRHHVEFLKSLEPSVEVTDVSSIRRWHPQFSLEDVPDIKPAPLPQPPTTQVLSNATHVLGVARDLFSKNPRLEAAVERAAEKLSSASAPASSATPVNESKASLPAVNPDLGKQQKPQGTPTQNKDVALALRGISVSLLEKIRAREAAAATRAMVRSAGDTRYLEVLSRLPELARILRHTLVAEKKAALHWQDAIARLRESHSGMLTVGEVEEHLEALLKEVPEWVSKHKLSSGVFLKLNKNKDINVIVDQLNATLKQKS